ncbi:hypothetical protein SBFV3_gp28 [Sulfolobales Beppu filamentous virus 3]|uniref:Uncharacterized protein n=1 Tax=Sulfolobales Beppu filamentous virus 3 TaxID=2493124 RepID=A0A3Q8Q3W0_9VIRU|nr:hypothetical protein HOU83_gp28 [Sulfolobales Beppu filamentous virus 3]AZI75863.1 hypothetical protein SBFV3_gp28 [Sulfolobales Beppu filamentous virus 3]
MLLVFLITVTVILSCILTLAIFFYSTPANINIGMSFISGIETAISNFFSGASDTFSGVVNFGSNIINGVQNAVQGVLHGLTNIAQGIYNGLLTIGNDIATVFGQLGGAIWHALVSFGVTAGTFFYEAFHTVASAVYGFGQRIASSLEYVGKWIWNALGVIGQALHNVGNWLYNAMYQLSNVFIDWLRFQYDIYLDLRNIFVAIWNWLVTAFQNIVNLFIDIGKTIESFGNDALSFLHSLYSDILHLPEDVSKYVATKMSNVIPRVVAYNLFFEEMKALDRVADNLARNITLTDRGFSLSRVFSPILVKVFSPFIAGFTSLLAQETLTKFFPEFSGVTPQQRKTLPTPPSSTISNSLSAVNPLTSITSIFTGTKPSPQTALTVQPPQLQSFQRYVVGVKQVDAITLLELPTVSNEVRSPFPNSATILEQVGVNGTLLVSPAQVESFNIADSVGITTFASLRLKTVTESDTIDVYSESGVFVNTFILGIPLCPLPSTLSAGSNFQPSDYISDNVELCLEPLSSVGQSEDAQATTYSSPYTPNAIKETNSITGKASVFTSTAPPNAISTTDSVSGSASTYSSSSAP